MASRSNSKQKEHRDHISLSQATLLSDNKRQQVLEQKKNPYRLIKQAKTQRSTHRTTYYFITFYNIFHEITNIILQAKSK